MSLMGHELGLEKAIECKFILLSQLVIIVVLLEQ